MKHRVPTCPIGKVVGLLGDSCSILIVRDLLEGPKRFSELETSLSGVSSRTLAKKLKLLEHERLVGKKEMKGKPACVKYQLTKKGAAFHEVVGAMRAYGKKYL